MTGGLFGSSSALGKPAFNTPGSTPSFFNTGGNLFGNQASSGGLFGSSSFLQSSSASLFNTGGQQLANVQAPGDLLQA